MTDEPISETESDKPFVQVWARLPASEEKRLRQRCADLDIKRPDGVREAVTEWLEKSILNSEDAALPNYQRESLPPSAGDDTRTTDVLQIVPEPTTWEQRAVEEILQTEYAEAFRVNIRAVYLLAMGRPVDASWKQSAADAGPPSVPGGKVETVHSRVGHHEQAYGAATEHLERPPDRRKRGRKPQTGTR